MNKNEAIGLIRAALITKSAIFESNKQNDLVRYRERYTSLNKEKYYFLYYPYDIGFGAVDGIKLKDNKGFVAIQEFFRITDRRNTLEKSGYVYKYITEEHVYTYQHPSSGDVKSNLLYNFHFDMDLNYNNSPENNHPPTHLQVMHSLPRFQTEEVSIINFLDAVIGFCFENESTLIPYTVPIYSMK